MLSFATGAITFRCREATNDYYAEDEMTKPGEPVVIYDGVCRLCNAWVRFLLAHRLARNIRFAPVQSPAGAALLRQIGQSAENIHTIVLIEGDRHWFRSAAIFRIMRALPWPWRLISLLRFLPHALSDFIYNRIAHNRYRLFGRYDTLHPLTADHPGRFLHEQ